MREYSSLQLLLDERVEAARERIIYVVTAYMDAQGFVPCGSGSADRTVAFARAKGGWAVFDDCADRLDICALHGLARCLTAKLGTRAVGIMGYKNGFMMRFYSDGILRDTFKTPSKSRSNSLGRVGCSGHAVRWRSIIRKGAGIRELSAAFLKATESPEEGLEQLIDVLCLDQSAKYGFASIEDANLEGVVKLYYHAANRVRQRWYDRFIRIPAKCTNAVVSAFFGKHRLGQRR